MFLCMSRQSIVDDMHEQVYSLVASDKAKDTIGILLDMHLLEDEQVRTYAHQRSLRFSLLSPQNSRQREAISVLEQ